MDLNIEMFKYASKLKVLTPGKLPGHKHHPNKEAFLMGAKVITNNYGLRDHKNLTPKVESIRIAFVGDSFTFGWGVNYANTIPKLLEDKANKTLSCSKRIEVFNLGVGNYNSSQQSHLYKELKDLIDPDYTIVLHFINDSEPFIASRPNIIEKNSYILNFIANRLNSKKVGNYSDYYQSLYSDDTWNGNKASILQIDRLAKENSKNNFTVFLLPELRQIGSYSPLIKTYSKRESFFKENKIEYYDLREFLNKKSNSDPSKLWVSKYDSHSNAFANKLISNYIFKKMSSRVLKACQ